MNNISGAGASQGVALFVDAENLTGWLTRDGPQRLFSVLAEYGPVIVRRAYGQWGRGGLASFQAQLHRAGFELVHTFHPVSKKNSVDIQMTVDVMEYTSRVPSLHWYVLATGDSDFSPLFRRLREMGKGVIGVGPRGKLSEAVKTSCSRYIHTELPSPQPDSQSTDQDFDDALLTLRAAMETFSEPANCSELKNRMLNIDPAFDEKVLGFKQFTQFLSRSGVVSVSANDQDVWFATLLDSAPGVPGGSPAPAPAAPVIEQLRAQLREKKLRVPTLRALKLTLEALVGDAVFRPRALLIEHLIERTPDDVEGTDLRKAQQLLYRATCFDVEKTSEAAPSAYRLKSALTVERGLWLSQLTLLKHAWPSTLDDLPLEDLQQFLLGEVDADYAAQIRDAARASRA